jgi:two-component system, NarL family, nitrate/nitrite response regulator NarL
MSVPAHPPADGREQVRVAILDDHVLFAQALEIALSLERYDVRRIPVPGSGGSLAAVGAAILRLRPQIALLDLDLGRIGDATELIGPLTLSGAAVIVVTASVDPSTWGECLNHGARTVVPKSRPLDEILAVVDRIHRGLPVIQPAEREALLRQWQQRQTELQDLRRRLARLTARERDVLGHLTVGRTVSEISALGTVSEATVRTQVKSILAKLEVSSQLTAVGIAHRAGWRSPVT